MRKKIFTGQIQPKKIPPTAKNNFSRGPAKKNIYGKSARLHARKNIYGPPGSARAKKIFIRASARKNFWALFYLWCCAPTRKINYLSSFLSKKMRPPRKKIIHGAAARQPRKKIIHGLPVRCPRKNNYLWPAGQAHSEKKYSPATLKVPKTQK